MIDVISIIREYYTAGTPLGDLFMDHACRVRDKALAVAGPLNDPTLDVAFIEEAAMLHDIGIFKTKAESIGCRGDVPYICHGVIGREMLESHNLSKHALVCERHVGIGLSVSDITGDGIDAQPIGAHGCCCNIENSVKHN